MLDKRTVLLYSEGGNMSKIAVFLPREYMRAQVDEIIKEEGYNIDIICVITTANAVGEARKAVDQGAGILVARGIQAFKISQYTDIPIVEIKLTTQELGLLIKKAKAMVNKQLVRIAVVGFDNIYSDMTYFEEIFDIKLQKYMITEIEESEEAVDRAIAEGADVILGGDVTNELARQKNMPTLFFESTKESLKIAIDTAKKMQYAAEMEKEYIAQFETVLDTSYNGIIKINGNKKITNVNKVIEELCKKKANVLIGEGVEEILPEMDGSRIDTVLSGIREIYTTSTKIRNKLFMVTVVPIVKEQNVSGAILSCYRINARESKEAEQFRGKKLSGYYAKATFSGFFSQSKLMKEAIGLAKTYALSRKPIVICTEEGCEKERFAQAIHNNSTYKGGPFVSIHCGGMNNEEQMRILFGSMDGKKQGALVTGDYGTVTIAEVDKLSLDCQYRLYQILKYDEFVQSDFSKGQSLDNRIIFTTSVDLGDLVRRGEFREDLFYYISALTLRIPPLRNCTEDILYCVEQHRKAFNKYYTSFVKISEEALKEIKAYDWPGNRIQLEAFCERLFLTTPKKVVGKAFVRKLLEEMYPVKEIIGDQEKVVVYQYPEAVKIKEILKKYQGNRGLVAKEMGISTTTLWRKIKKYNL